MRQILGHGAAQLIGLPHVEHRIGIALCSERLPDRNRSSIIAGAPQVDAAAHCRRRRQPERRLPVPASSWRPRPAARRGTTWPTPQLPASGFGSCTPHHVSTLDRHPHPASDRNAVERRVAGADKAVPGDPPRCLFIEQDDIGRRPDRQRAARQAEQARPAPLSSSAAPPPMTACHSAPATVPVPASVSAPAMPGNASANGSRFSSWLRGSWPDAMMLIVPSPIAASTARRSSSLRSGGDRRAKLRKPATAVSLSSQ